jgi:hypothetical protein
MNSVICTLFESHYHYGVAALVNSLYTQGFRGNIFAGYKGSLPTWVLGATEEANVETYPGSVTLRVTTDLSVHFLPLLTDYHLTNYKPDFMLSLLDGPAKEAEGIYYFDPDIVLNTNWSYLEEWINFGVAFCEDVNSPLSKNHPRRVAWRRYYQPKGIDLFFKDNCYVNGGFIGLKKADRSYLEHWKNIQEIMAPAIGGLNRSAFAEKQLPVEVQGPLAPFGRTDQDAMNIAIESWDGVASISGRDAMAFSSGTYVMPHALGHHKPWMLKPIKQALKGLSPRYVDKLFWKFADGPIKAHKSGVVKWRLTGIKIAAIIGRFYKRA